ncbi:rhomboid family intramembrane serine protease [Histidinibacterium lentulum]|uniref:Rhomboid family intramembrane serine protease n=2 Tax=Histidinibacterium lentulum TaxID=2480588 RepID=A0A3N2R1E8_9RHOB|nr:rhomboid family intramembrane serine protease [Histidinibacterium lentulum]
MVAAEAVLGLAQSGFLGGPQGIGWRLEAVERFAFAPRVVELVFERGVLAPEVLMRFVSYIFVHGSLGHAAFGIVILLAMGKFAGEVLDGLGLTVVVGMSTVTGALVFGVAVQQNVPLYGSYPAAYGLIGAYTALVFVALGRAGERQLAAFRLIGVLVAIQLVFAALFGADLSWIADLAGFATGFVLTPLLAPGGWAALMRRIRAR